MSSFAIQPSHGLEEEVSAAGYTTLANKSLKSLTEREVRLVRQIVRVSNAQRYTVRQLFGEHWEHVLSKRSFGRRFKRAVLDGLIVGIEMRERNSSKTRMYEVLLHGVAANDDFALRLA